MKKSRQCCEEVRSALADLFINIKIRNDSSMQDITSEKLDEERKELEGRDGLYLVECIRKTIEVLINMKMDEQNMLVSNRSMSSIKVAKNLQREMMSEVKTERKKHKEHEKENDQGYAKLLEEMESQRSNFSTTQNSMGYPPKAYEEVIQKLEADVRMHIRIEQQMRLHIDNLSQKIEDMEKAKSILEREYQEDMQEVKQEKRRLGDLLTLREDEIAKAKSDEGKQLREKDGVIADMERKLKHIEKKYEKALKKLQGAEQDQIKKVSFKAAEEISKVDSASSKPTEKKPSSSSQSQANLQKILQQRHEEQLYQQQQDIQQLRQEYKKKRGNELGRGDNRNYSQIMGTSNSSNASSSYGGTHAKKRSKGANSSSNISEYQAYLLNSTASGPITSAPMDVAFQKALEDKNDEISKLKEKLNCIQSQVVAAKRQSTSSELLQKKGKGNTSLVASGVSAAYFKNAQNLQEEKSSSGHKRAKTHINFYNNPYQDSSMVEGPKIIEQVAKFDLEKENFGSHQSAAFMKTYAVQADIKRTNSNDGLQKQEQNFGTDGVMNKTCDLREQMHSLAKKSYNYQQSLNSSRANHSSQRPKSIEKAPSMSISSLGKKKKNSTNSINYHQHRASDCLSHSQSVAMINSQQQQQQQQRQIAQVAVLASASVNKLPLAGGAQK